MKGARDHGREDRMNIVDESVVNSDKKERHNIQWHSPHFS